MKQQNEADKVVSDLQKDFKLVGTSRVHSWYAWAIVGIVFGMAIGIVYVANRSGKFDNSHADELSVKIDQDSGLRFIYPENNTIGETNPLLEVESLGADGKPSLLPIAFSYALAGTNDFRPLPGSYNLGIYHPGHSYYIPAVFADHLLDSEVVPAIPAGDYTIRVTREADCGVSTRADEKSEYTAQANLNLQPQLFNNPPLGNPGPGGGIPCGSPALADLHFRFNPRTPMSSTPKPISCGCENIAKETSGSIDPKFFAPANEIAPGNSGLGPYSHSFVTSYAVRANFSYIFQLKATLTPGSDPVLCSEGQKIKATSVAILGSDEELISHPTLVDGQGGFGSSLGGTLAGFISSDDKNAMTAAKPSTVIQSFPAEGLEYGPDDYNSTSEVKYHDKASNIIKWFDAPGAYGVAKKIFGEDISGLPASYEGDFIHYVNGSFGTSLPDGTVVSLPGKSCTCRSHLLITVNEDGEAKFDATSDCDASNRGKNGI